MRNWNEIGASAVPYRQEGSQPTYEELKPGLFASKFFKSVCSQPTYEELKRQVLGTLGHALYGSQPTYEELKHTLL